MPYKQSYNRKTVGKGASRTPMSVMGGQGKSIKIMPMHSVQKATKKTSFGK